MLIGIKIRNRKYNIIKFKIIGSFISNIHLYSCKGIRKRIINIKLKYINNIRNTDRNYKNIYLK